MPPNEDPPSWSYGLSMQRVNDVANMWGCNMPNPRTPTKDSNCPVNATMDGTVANPETDPQFCDRIIAGNARI